MQNGNAGAGPLIGLIIFFAIVIGIFLLIRTFWLWYFKLDLIEAHLAKLVRQGEAAKKDLK